MDKNEILKCEVLNYIGECANEAEIMMDTFGIMVNQYIAVLDQGVDKLINYIKDKVISAIIFLDKDRENDLEISFSDGKKIIIGYL
ncbi:hypothetical protein FDA25_02430 [Clostridium botulinum]|nr:hypothetical protein [Clostridium botulinum]NFH71471.1 hypothetical protein [Clostridium botulinum]NFI79774.1 hypothetical protein [Clostridium botulinum]NFJ70917.1 hypothetical protein [Clostridium botulinum]NFM10028.1 hypothetical protein [Clostridium botulinum]